MDKSTQPESITRIAKGTRITADIQSIADIHISGTVDGDIKTDRNLILAETGRITGSVIAKEAVLSGRFTGELRALKSISLHKSAVVDGFLFSKTITVQENANLIGIVSVGKDVDVLNTKITKNPKRREPQKIEKTEADQPNKVQPEPLEPTEPKVNVSRYLANVYIGIPNSSLEKNKAEELKSACDNFMEALGFSLEIFDEPTYAPFLQKLAYVRKSTENEAEINDRYRKGKGSLETALLKKDEGNNLSELQLAANTIISLFRNLDEYVLILGNIMLIQLFEDQVQTVAAKVLPEELRKQLNKNPELAAQPQKVYSFIN